MTEEVKTGFLGRTFSSWKNPSYRFYYGGMMGQMAAMNMQMVANSLLIYRLTLSPAILGAMSFANALPMILFSLFGGVMADRMQKKIVMLIGQGGFALVSLFVAITLTTGYLGAEHPGSWWVLVVSAALQGTIMGLMMPSRQAIIPQIVQSEQLMNAISLNILGMNILQLFAPAIAGFLVDAFDFQAVYYVMTAMYIVAIVFFAVLQPTSISTAHRGSMISNIKEGLHYVRHDVIILPVLLFSLVVVVLSMPYLALMPIFVDDVLKVGATGMGFLLSASGIGAATGSFFLASLPNRKRGFLMLVSSLLLGVALIGFSFSNSWTFSLAIIVFVGLGQTGRMALSNILLQYYVKDEYVGRVMSLFLMQFGLTSFSAFAAGLLTEAIGIQWAVGSFAIALVVLSVLALIFLPGLRRLD